MCEVEGRVEVVLPEPDYHHCHYLCLLCDFCRIILGLLLVRDPSECTNDLDMLLRGGILSEPWEVVLHSVHVPRQKNSVPRGSRRTDCTVNRDGVSHSQLLHELSWR